MERDEAITKAKKVIEIARNSKGKERVDAVIRCEHILIYAGFAPADLAQIGSSREEFKELVNTGHKEMLKES